MLQLQHFGGYFGGSITHEPIADRESEPMKPIAVFQHHADDGPGYFAEFLARAGLSSRLFHLAHGDAPPDSLSAYAGLCVLGGPMGANDDLPWLQAEMKLIREAIIADIPVIGHCLGGQLLARALGGVVTRSPMVEIGWSDLSVNDPQGARWFGGREALRFFQWHGDTFSIPPEATQIVSGQYCANQAFVYGRKHLGMQFHCEIDAGKVKTWLVNDRQELVSCVSPAVQQAEALLPTLAADVAESQRIADAIYGEWIKGL